jgi:choline dehydrogenase-like flavoprotein
VSRLAFLPEDPEGTDWEVAVVGAGMGGATVGYALARRGRRVLFLEKGRFLQRDAEVERGDLVDQGEHPEARLRRGRWPLPIQGATSFGELDFFAPLGCGTGGSSALYGATLERLWPADFRPKANYPEVEDSSLPEAWPISYADLEPYYRQAEQLFRVRGTPDPLHPAASGPLLEPPPLAERDQDVHDLFVRKGLHPYRVHVGYEFVEGCEGCGGVVCLRGCKADAGWICLVPALEKFGAKLLPRCEVSRLEADRSAVRALRCTWGGGELSITARVFVLAAGALMTPVLLLNSRCDEWPEGLANRSGLVGRNLMMHSTDTIAVRPDRAGSRIGPVKSLALNDLYFCEGRKLGNLQSVGVPVSTGNVLAHLRTVVDRNPTWWARLAPPFLRVGARLGELYFRNDVVFASIVEDLPYHRNRVVPDPSARNGMRFEYHYPEELRERTALFRRRLVQMLGRRRVFCLTSKNNLNFGHPCGTCRFGDDPAASVLDRNNRAHGIANLYVVDASFFPSSGGANPSLTIAANALRVAEAIDRQLA